MEPGLIMIDRVVGMTVYKTIQRWKFTSNSFFQADGGSPAMDKANPKVGNIDDPFFWQQRFHFSCVHIPGDGNQIPLSEKIDDVLGNKVPCVQYHLYVTEMRQDNPFQLLGWIFEMGIRDYTDLHLYHQ